MSHLEHPLTKDSISDFLSLPSIENPDWGYARNKRCVLMTPSAEWVQSIYSCQFELNGKRFIVPNRDYPYEGLLVYQDGENWKFIDCIALALQHQDGRYIPFVIDSSYPTVKINPWKSTYCYKILGANIKSGKDGEIPFFVSYYLNSKNTPELITGCVELYFPQGLIYDGLGIIPTIEPFVDIRHMYGASNFCNYDVRVDGYKEKHKRIHISNYNRTLTFYLPPVESTLFEIPEMLHWRCKLGTGTRVESFNHNYQRMETIFIGEDKNMAAFFNLQIPCSYGQKFVRLFWGCGLNDNPTNFFLPEMEIIFENSRKKDHHQLQQIKKIFPLPENIEFRDAILARIVGLIKFKTYIHLAKSPTCIQVPHAGAWWFKTPWYRDVFEGILNSFETLMKIPEEKQNIRRIILLALRGQDETSGRILSRIPEFKHLERSYNSSDSTLLCFIAANAYIKDTRELDFALEVLPYAMKTISCFQKGNVEAYNLFCIDGPPRVDGKSCLLLSTPHHSWIDTRSQCLEYGGWKIEGLPNRVSKKFVKDLYDQIANKEMIGDILSSPNFFLPEINAQWITMLKGIIETIDFVINQKLQQEIDIKSIKCLKETIDDMLSRAKENFKRIFWNDHNGFLFNIVYENGTIMDGVECETGVTAAAMLGEAIFTHKELSSIWNCIKKKLLVYRKLVKYGEKILPFGIITKNEDQRVYYNDDQYHSDVTWLRSSPYLIKLLRLLNQENTIKEILINTLDHQMTEGAIFYNQELFSRPFGNNPHPDEYTHQNPVPVKNPIQFWSQWCDAFIEYFGERRD